MPVRQQRLADRIDAVDLDSEFTWARCCGRGVFHRKDVACKWPWLGPSNQFCQAIGRHGIILTDISEWPAAWPRTPVGSSDPLAQHYATVRQGLEPRFANTLVDLANEYEGAETEIRGLTLGRYNPYIREVRTAAATHYLFPRLKSCGSVHCKIKSGRYV